jgi:hypothetical protein
MKGKKVGAAEWVRSKCDEISDTDVTLHPRTSHLLFWQAKGSKRNGGVYLPWNNVDDLHNYLGSIGIAEGALACSGDMQDLQDIAALVKRCSPVIAVKSVGGASERIAHAFEHRQKIQPNKAPGSGLNRPRGFSNQYPDAVFQGIDNEQFLDVGFSVFSEHASVEDREMIVVDAVNPAVGQVIQKQMAELLTMNGADTEERQLGFAATERARFTKAWNLALLFTANAKVEKFHADIFNYIIIVLNVLVVLSVVVKQLFFTLDAREHKHLGCNPYQAALGRKLQALASASELSETLAAEFQLPSPEFCTEALQVCSVSAELGHTLVAANSTGAGVTATADPSVDGHVDEGSEQIMGMTVDEWNGILTFSLVFIPMISGVMLTLNNAFHPFQKHCALKWAAAKIESSIYIYRARSLGFSYGPPGSSEWAIDSDDAVKGKTEKREKIATIFVKAVSLGA